MFTLTFAQKLALSMISMILLSAGILGYPMVYRQFSLMEEQFNVMGTTLVNQLATNAIELVFVKDELKLGQLVKNISEQTDVLSTVIVNKDQEIVTGSGIQPPNHWLYDRMNTQESGFALDENNIGWFYQPIVFNGVTGGVAWIGLDKSQLIENQRFIVSSGLTLVALMVLSIMLLAVRISRNLSKPILEIISASEAIASGRLSFRMRGDYSGEFTAVKSAFNNMADGLEQKLTLEKNISRFVSSSVAENYMSREDEDFTLQGERVEASIIFVDLVGYTNFSNNHSPEVIADVLNFYFTEFANTCHAHQGNVDKFIGDCAMLVFGCPSYDPQHRQHALNCAVQIRDDIAILNKQRQQEKLPWLDIRIGLASGEVLAGLLGSPERLNYSVVGDAANLAARLCDKAPCGQILTDRAFIESVRANQNGFGISTHQTQQVQVKGFTNAIDTLVIDQIESNDEK
ncbi:adenylate/guanylate cyclase domain-containing protein [Reinekea forsetii]|nr:adenylate/guanylate cyclase domain-containing protein [Reinekea forsetii]